MEKASRYTVLSEAKRGILGGLLEPQRLLETLPSPTLRLSAWWLAGAEQRWDPEQQKEEKGKGKLNEDTLFKI